MFILLPLHLFNRFLKILTVFFPVLGTYDWIAHSNYKELCLKLARKGVTMGEGSMVYNCTFSASAKGDKFIIGNNCTITGTTLLGHDASPAIFLEELKNKDKPWLPGARSSYRNPITIGDNVFVGVGSIILPGITIGNNVIVAAGSVVTKDVLENCIVAGNPAKVINDIENYKKKYRQLLASNPQDF